MKHLGCSSADVDLISSASRRNFTTVLRRNICNGPSGQERNRGLSWKVALGCDITSDSVIPVTSDLGH